MMKLILSLILTFSYCSVMIAQDNNVPLIRFDDELCTSYFDALEIQVCTRDFITPDPHVVQVFALKGFIYAMDTLLNRVEDLTKADSYLITVTVLLEDGQSSVIYTVSAADVRKVFIHEISIEEFEKRVSIKETGVGLIKKTIADI